MNRPVFAILALTLAIALCLPVSAKTHLDDMDDLGGNSIKQYSNLAAYSFSTGSASMPDTSAFTFGNVSKPVAWAQYRVSGATGVTAAIYTASGTFVSQRSDGISMLGIFQENMNASLLRGSPQALYCPSANAVYTADRSKQLYIDAFRNYQFGPVVTPPQSSPVGYGVNISYSLDGAGFTYAQASRTGLQFDNSNAFCYEEYSASVPASALYVRVEINDVTSIPHVNGGYVEKPRKSLTALASVSISGDSLTLGEPEPTVNMPATVIIIEESEKSSASEKKASGSRSAARESSSGRSASQSSGSSSKFEGTITSASGSAKKSSPKSSSKSQPSSSESSGSVDTPEPEVPRDETVVYKIPRGESSNSFNTGVIAYIIIVSGAILLIVVLPKRK